MGHSFHLEVVIVSLYWEVHVAVYCETLSSSFPVTSSIVVLWHPTILFALGSPGKTATIQGFPEANPPTEAVMVSPRIAPVISRFNSLTEVVMISTYHLSSSVWSHGMRGPASLTTSPVGMIQATILMGLGTSMGPDGVWSTSATVGKGIGSTGVD